MISVSQAQIVGLIMELRCDPSGPFSWGPMGLPPAGGEGAVCESWKPRVQSTMEVPSILPGAFAKVAPATRATRIREALQQRRPENPQSVGVLLWLQSDDAAHLRDGLKALYSAVARAAAPPPIQQAWKSLPSHLGTPARLEFGRTAVAQAVAFWEQVRPCCP